MSTRGWVSAETGPEEWHLLRVFDDGWVEIPGFARTLSGTRANLRRALLGLVVLIGGLGLIALIAALLSRQDDPPVVLLFLPVLLAFALMLGLWVWRLRVSWRGSRQVVDDHRQARQRPATSRVRRAPGAPLFRRATTAEEYAGWIVGETHVLATDFVDVSAARESKLHVVTVRLCDGRTRVYRSPDGKLAQLLLGLRPGLAPDH